MPSASSHSCLSQGSIKTSNSSSCLTAHNVPNPVLGSGSSMPQGAPLCPHRGSVWGKVQDEQGGAKAGVGSASHLSSTHRRNSGNNYLMGSDLSTDMLTYLIITRTHFTDENTEAGRS